MTRRSGYEGTRESRRPDRTNSRRQWLVKLDREDIEAIAASVVELLERRGGGQPAHEEGLATAAELAALLGVHKSWVYAHQELLGGVRLGSGPKARLRFDAARAKWALQHERKARSASPRRRPGRPRKRNMLPPGVKLLTGRNGDQSQR